jgi:hypothetical protein
MLTHTYRNEVRERGIGHKGSDIWRFAPFSRSVTRDRPCLHIDSLDKNGEELPLPFRYPTNPKSQQLEGWFIVVTKARFE